MGFGFHNTILIDSELDKVKDYPKNSIVLKPYEASEVLNPSDDQSKILLNCRDYIFKLVDSLDSVPDFITANPFVQEASVSSQVHDPESSQSGVKVDDVVKKLSDLQV